MCPSKRGTGYGPLKAQQEGRRNDRFRILVWMHRILQRTNFFSLSTTCARAHRADTPRLGVRIQTNHRYTCVSALSGSLPRDHSRHTPQQQRRPVQAGEGSSATGERLPLFVLIYHALNTCMSGLSRDGSLMTVNGKNRSAASASPPITTFAAEGSRARATPTDSHRTKHAGCCTIFFCKHTVLLHTTTRPESNKGETKLFYSPRARARAQRFFVCCALRLAVYRPSCGVGLGREVGENQACGHIDAGSVACGRAN